MKCAQLVVPVAVAALGLAAAAGRPASEVVRPPETWQTLEANVSVPPAVSKIIARACRNCHSNETVWPWYAKLAPINWVIEQDVARARSAMNFSTWAAGSGRTPRIAAATLAAACADIQSDRMPLAPYRLMHSESRLS